ncbi:MAG TPA: hypothetical protein VK459_11590, partial [Polyangiaceae bacterium]|nr:hypothetical protein [Polyangiaceae bacterium]
ALIDTEHARARKILTERRAVLDTIATRLLEVETLERAELERMVGEPLPERKSGGLGGLGKDIRPPEPLGNQVPRAAEFDGGEDL